MPDLFGGVLMRGRCMCGAVGFEAEPKAMTFHACHCEMCRHWTGSALLAVTVPDGAIRFLGAEAIRTFQSSPWAERAWCDRCGSNLYYRITTEGPMRGTYYVSLGTFEAPEAFAFASEIYFDCKPASYGFAGTRRTLTKAEVEATYAGGKP